MKVIRKLYIFESISVDGYFTDQNSDMSWAHAGREATERRTCPGIMPAAIRLVHCTMVSRQPRRARAKNCLDRGVPRRRLVFGPRRFRALHATRRAGDHPLHAPVGPTAGPSRRANVRGVPDGSVRAHASPPPVRSGPPSSFGERAPRRPRVGRFRKSLEAERSEDGLVA